VSTIQESADPPSRQEMTEEEAEKHRTILVSLRELYDAAVAGENGRHYLAMRAIKDGRAPGVD
jgi:phage/plasmid primase-like uncharacterized protein